jgi:guanylate kinase
MRGRLFIISAPSGAGKTSLVEAVIPLVNRQHPIEQVITYTTKKPRSTDPTKKDFHFIGTTEFERRIKEQFFLEYSDAYGAYYGSPRSVIDEMQQGKSFILVIDRVGAQQVIKQIPDAVLVWISVANTEVLRERLTARATESQAQIEYRLQRAQVEIDLETENRLYTYHVVNDNFTTAIEKLVSIMRGKIGLI